MFTVWPDFSASFAAIVQLAECDALSGPQLSAEPLRIAFAHALISRVLGEIAGGAAAGFGCVR